MLARRAIGTTDERPPTPDGLYGEAHAGRTIRCLVIGDSAAVGYGMTTSDTTPTGLLGVGLAHVLDAQVEMRCHAVVGAQTSDLKAQIELAEDFKPDVAVIVVGTNDVTHRVPPRTIGSRMLAEVVTQLTADGCRGRRRHLPRSRHRAPDPPAAARGRSALEPHPGPPADHRRRRRRWSRRLARRPARRAVQRAARRDVRRRSLPPVGCGLRQHGLGAHTGRRCIAQRSAAGRHRRRRAARRHVARRGGDPGLGAARHPGRPQRSPGQRAAPPPTRARSVRSPRHTTMAGPEGTGHRRVAWCASRRHAGSRGCAAARCRARPR